MKRLVSIILIICITLTGCCEKQEPVNVIVPEIPAEVSVYDLKSEGRLHILSNFKVYSQTTDYTCGPSCLYMVLDYFGILGEETEMSLAEKSGTKAESGSLIYPMADVIVNRVSKVGVMNRKFADSDAFGVYVLSMIDDGSPIIICKDHHYRVIIGINTEDKTLYFADSRDNKDGKEDGYNIEYLDSFFNGWNPIYMVVKK